MSYNFIIIAASTGGPSALRIILKQMPKDFSIPIIIVQRIPPGIFAESLAEALNEISPLKVRVAFDDRPITKNEAVLIPGGYDIAFLNNKFRLIKSIDSDNTPSISNTIKEAIEYYKNSIILTVLTGISLEKDLIDNIKMLKNEKGNVIVQSPSTCFISDLPQTVINENLHDNILPIDKIASGLTNLSK